MSTPTTFVVPIRDGAPMVPKSIEYLVRGFVGQTACEIQVYKPSDVRYLRKRRYALETTGHEIVVEQLQDLPREHVSWTQIAMYLRCSMQYYFRYIEGLKIPPDSARVTGRAVHSAAERNYVHKHRERVDLPLEAIRQAYSDAFDANAAEAVWKPDEKPGRVKDEGIKLVDAFGQHIAPKVQPAMVEQKFEIRFDNVPYTLMGYIDVADQSRVIRDLKTMARSPAKDTNPADESMQLTVYALGYRVSTGQLESGLAMDVITKTKEPKALHYPTTRTQQQIDYMLQTVGYVCRGIQLGQFYRVAPESWTSPCNTCGYYERCWGRPRRPVGG